MSLRQLPARPNLEHLKKQARKLLREFLQDDPAAVGRFREAANALPAGSAPKLADALHVIAREYGFDSWPKLKARVETLSEDPAEALKAAIRADDAALVREVIARHPVLKTKIDEPLPDFDFESPALIGAVNKGNRAMIDALLEAGANINARTKWWAGGFGVLDNCGPELAAYLIERGAYVDVHAAARLGMFERVKALVEADPALVDAPGGDGQRPLHFAANIEIAEYLLEHGAEIDARDVDHESTAAQYAAAHRPRRPDVAGYLLWRGAKSDILMASALGDLDLVRQYLDGDPASVGVSVSERDFPKENPRSGGSIYIYGFGWSKTPHMLAREFGHDEVFRLLMERSPVELRLAQACEMGDEALARQLLAQDPEIGGNLSAEAKQGVVGAALRNNAKAVRMMLDAGWPVDARGDRGQTPLHWAGFHGNVEMVRALLRHKAPLEPQEWQFKGTPLGWALYGSEHGWHRETGDYPGVVRALLAAGAKAPGDIDSVEAAEEVLAVLRTVPRA
jgi:ankyrin repeat protein